MISKIKALRNIPHEPGVYIYKSESKDILYIGKAKNLYNRVSQYWQKDIADQKTVQLVSQIHTVDTIKTDTEFDALLLEAKLIQNYKPKYNIILKDDKSPLYIVLTTSEPLPRVLTVRRNEISHILHKNDTLFGPFQSSFVVRSILRQLRHIIPYCIQKQRNGKKCFYTHIGLCNPCPSFITGVTDNDQKKKLIREYRSNIFRLKNILSGSSASVLIELEKEMYTYAENQNFEKAKEIYNKINQFKSLLQKKYDPNVYIQNTLAVESIHTSQIQSFIKLLRRYFPNISSLERIECIDISNIQGNFASGSLVVFSDGVKNSDEYRRFRIRIGSHPNDYAMIEEVVRRRFSHNEWRFPELLIVDGGKGQIRSAITALNALNISLPVIGIAKRNEEIIIPVHQGFSTIRIPWSDPALRLIQRIRDEAHRFALRYHRHLRKTKFLSLNN